MAAGTTKRGRVRNRIGWAAETPGMFTATLGMGPHGARHHLVVEALPLGGWDWVAWAADGPRRCLDGTAGSLQDAMQAAARAAKLLQATPAPGVRRQAPAPILN